MKKILTCSFAVAFIIIGKLSFAQADTMRIKREQQQKMQQMKEAQQKAIQQMKEMGIEIDPNKKMTREEAELMKKKLITKGNQAKMQMPQLQLKERTQTDFKIKEPVTKETIASIAAKFFRRSYTSLPAAAKTQYDKDYNAALQQSFSASSIHLLVTKGKKLFADGQNYQSACTYLSAAAKNQQQDTFCINSFGEFLLATDSSHAAVIVLYYANKLSPKNFSVLTNLGHAFLQANDFRKAEQYTREALQLNPANGNAHAVLCETLIYQKRKKEAVKELFDGLRYKGCTYEQASRLFYSLTSGGKGQQQKNNFDLTTSGIMNSNDDLAPLVPDDDLAPLVPPDDGGIGEVMDEIKKELNAPDALASLVPEEDDVLAPLVPAEDKIKLQDLPLSGSPKVWMENGGFSGAFNRYQHFMGELTEFEKEYKMLHEQGKLQSQKIIHKNFNQRFAVDCIAQMFTKESEKERKRYSAETKNFYNCDHYKPWEDAFKKTVDKQQKILDDLYGFAEPWLKKISDPYWNKIYTYKVKRVALIITGNCYSQYPKPFPTNCTF